nr:ribonuclease H-like domain-containing protein [Tanacetum cinerariifolium]GEV38286.1 ribonuclease H-like domain-containing protein [Tanacetum cinerariifolium]
DCDVYDTVDNFPSVVSKAAYVPAGSRHSSASTSAGSFIPVLVETDQHLFMLVDPFLLLVETNQHLFMLVDVFLLTLYAMGVQEQWWISSIYMVSYLVIHKAGSNIDIVDSGCFRSMTGNKEKLDDFVQVKRGTITFGGGDSKITGKGTIRTSKLNFENVYYVKELQNFNLFYVSQICDKKNKVFFTDDECLVLTKEFQLPDESQVVLRIPRRHDLYTFNLSDIQLEQHINCLLAKASLKESTKWHRRMAHVNFKTINKLAKNGLVEGLPLKLFTN